MENIQYVSTVGVDVTFLTVLTCINFVILVLSSIVLFINDKKFFENLFKGGDDNEN